MQNKVTADFMQMKQNASYQKSRTKSEYKHTYKSVMVINDSNLTVVEDFKFFACDV